MKVLIREKPVHNAERKRLTRRDRIGGEIKLARLGAADELR